MLMAWTHLFTLLYAVKSCEWTTTFSVYSDQANSIVYHTTFSKAAVYSSLCIVSTVWHFCILQLPSKRFSMELTMEYCIPKCKALSPIPDEQQPMHKAVSPKNVAMIKTAVTSVKKTNKCIFNLLQFLTGLNIPDTKEFTSEMTTSHFMDFLDFMDLTYYQRVQRFRNHKKKKKFIIKITRLKFVGTAGHFRNHSSYKRKPCCG